MEAGAPSENMKGQHVDDFFWVEPGQPIWPVTQSLDRVDDRVGFQNYGWMSSRSSCLTFPGCQDCGSNCFPTSVFTTFISLFPQFDSCIPVRPVCLLESSFLLESEFREKWIFGKWISRKYFSIFGSVIENKLENTFQCLVMSWKISWKITY